MSGPNEQAATNADIAELRTEFRAEMEQLREQIVEEIRDSQTEVLRAIYGCTQSIQERLSGQDAADNSLKERMTVLEDRVLEVEKRLNLPAQPSAPLKSHSQVADSIQQKALEGMRKIAKENPKYQVPY